MSKCPKCGHDPEAAATESAFPGLNLCDTRSLLSPEQQRKLDDDLRALASARRRAEASARDIWLA